MRDRARLAALVSPSSDACSGLRATSLSGHQAGPTSPERQHCGDQVRDRSPEVTGLSEQATAPVQRLLHLRRPTALCALALPVEESVPGVPVSKSDAGPNPLVGSSGASTPASCNCEYQGSSRGSQLRIPVPPPMSPVRGKWRPHHSRRAKTLFEPPLATSTSAQATSPSHSELPLNKPSGHCPRRHSCHSELPLSAMTPTSAASSSTSTKDSTGSCTPSEVSHSSTTTNSIHGMCWRRGARIGRGSYGCVYKALNTSTGQIFAIKEAVFSQGDEDDRRFHGRLENELRICQGLRHPHIVSYLGHSYEAARLCIYLEYMPGGSLAAFLKEFGPVAGTCFGTATRGLLEGLNYLHTRSPPVLHRDIKAANVLVDLEFCVKLADFGCSAQEAVTKSFTMLGSIPWMAPEVIRQQDGHGRKADIWSLGCTLIEMGTAEKPWGDNAFDNVIYALQHIGFSGAIPPLPNELCDEGRELISRCTRWSPGERPWAAELLLHPLVAGPAS